jgi:hypothetical protein
VDQRTLNELADELREVFVRLGVPGSVEAGVVRADGPGELVLTADGRTVTIAVTTRADLRPAQAKELPQVGGTDQAATGMVFADRLADNTREVLRDRGWGWFDRRRGHLRLWAAGLRLDATVEPTAPIDDTTRVRDPFSAAGRRLALWLLLHPNDPASPRAISRELGVSAGQISNLLGALKAESLLRRDRTPLVPELFWALAERWKPKRHALASMPPHAELAAATELQTKQWVLSDTRAASAYGAPVAAGPAYPPDLYVPDQKALTWLMNRSVVAPDFSQRVATVAVVPTSLACEARFRRRDPHEQWPLAHPVVVALDLAVDRSRGREVVEQWDPDPSLDVERVW